MYKLGLKLWSSNIDNYYNEAIKLYADGLFDYIELFIVPDTWNTLPQWYTLHTHHKIPFIIHCPHTAFGFNMALRQMADHNKKIYNHVKKFADTLESKHIIFHGGIDGTIEETARQLCTFKEPRALIENKPMLPLPNDKGWLECRGYNTSEIKYIIDTVDCGLCLDFGHAVSAAIAQNKKPYMYIKEFMNLNPKMFHLADKDDMKNPYDSHLHLGTGKLNIDKIKTLLPQKAIVTLETVKTSKYDLDDFIGDVKCMKR